MTYSLRFLLTLVLVTGLIELGPHARVARAALVSTEDALERSATADAARDRVRAVLAREDVRRELASLGVDPDDAASRVALLSDAEVEVVAGKLDRLPAGGDTIVAVLLIIVVVFLILIFTDAVGITDIFPWVNKPQRR
jgi:hypothetical protein